MPESRRAITFLGNYLPRKCGIATFTTDLCEAVADKVSEQQDVFAIAMTNRPQGYDYPPRVRFEIRHQNLTDYEQAADFINTSKVDVLCIQHEYGIFGGKWGSYLHTLLRKIRVPIVTTLHTLLEEEHSQQKEIFKELVARSDRLVVMSKRAIQMLEKQGVKNDKIVYIPHGIPDLPFVDSNFYKDRFGIVGKKLILTFGLLNPGKGVEYMLNALPKIIEKYPDVVYIVLGATHPEVLKVSGEEYRMKLIRQVDSLGLSKHVQFHNRFVELDELCEYLCACDIYVMPYLNKEQIISGTLAYALGAGKVVISTPTWCAEELLADGRGRLVPFRNSEALTEAVLEILGNEVATHAIKKQGYQFSRNMVWAEVAKEYIKLFNKVQEERRLITIHREPFISTTKFPEPNLEQLTVLTDDFGLVQHAKFTIPDYAHGYCVDDNARAIVVATKHYNIFKDNESLDLLRKYFAFVLYSQREDGLFRNYYNMAKLPINENEIGSDDCQGRALWGLGYVVANGPDYFWVVAKASFDKAIPHAEKFNLRGSAFSILGIKYYLKRYPGALTYKHILEKLADKIIDYYDKHAGKNWHWFEKKITYSNGLLPTSLWVAYQIIQKERYAEVAKLTTDFLMDKCRKKDRVSLVGNNGWLKETDMTKADFDQQPVDAMWLVEMGRAAYEVKKDTSYLLFMRQAFDWFLGVNDLGEPLYDYVTGGCYDGLTPTGPNLNQGAESTLSCLLALLTITEMSHEEEIEANETDKRRQT